MEINKTDKGIARWLLIGVAMIVVQILLGGITRLTGSGLSITEWNLATGILPPLNEQQWLAAFEKYKATEQFKQLNSGFTLPDFKFIFFWEWFHRLWGRLIGVVFAIPFIIFLVQKRFKKEMVLPLIILFLLGALQGAVGWIMVASGLTGDAVYVRPTKLAMHFVLALVLLCYTYWFALKFLIRSESLVYNKGLKTFTWVLVIVLFVQLFYGAMMAGYKAAPYAPTWPDINGDIVPHAMTSKMPGNMNDADAKSWTERQAIITTHFIHRTLAYSLVVLIVIWTISAGRIKGSVAFRKIRWFPLVFVAWQTVLGILTVLSSTGIRAYRWNEFEWMAQLHQLTAIFLLISLIHALYLVRNTRG
jgi:cytochrome c oxidase assembly protein subunit 15